MNLRKRVMTLVFLTATALGTLGAPAMAVPMPWETSGTPTTGVTVQTGTFTVLCANGCYQ